MPGYFLLCNFTEQGIRNVKESPSRRAAARELGKKLGVELKAGYMALGAYDVIIHAEAASDEMMARFVMSLAAKGNLRTTTVRVFDEAEADKIIASIV